ncbi:cyclin-T-like [Pollicipes pollicipes]|uniref:cyclin-T-like n=1 Tax=Pollicipes pollicipes TaxID=41117 RepID=UPI0018851F2E|nr:cyclin-T-like [Pollicipes pollicipes]
MMCLEYRSTLVACVCIYLVYKWSGHEIPKSSKGKDWFWYVDRDVTLEQLERVSEEFLLIFNQCPSKLKKKIMNSSRAISDQEAEQRKHEVIREAATSAAGRAEAGEEGRQRRSDLERRGTLPAAAKDPLSGGSSNNNLALTLKSIKEEFLPLGHPLPAATCWSRVLGITKELVLPKVDDIPIFSPLKGGGTSSIKLPRAPLPSELRSVSISSHDSDFEVVELRDRPPDAGAEPAVAAPSALAADAGTAGAASAATAAPALAKVVSAPSSLLNAPIARDLFGDDAGRDDRHKHHKEKKKKKKEHKEHKEHKHKKEKKHKEHKEKRKDKHRDREEEVSKRTFTISKDKVGGCEPAPALEPGTAGSSLKLTIRPVVSPVSSPGSTLKFRIGKDTRVAPAEGFKKKRRRDSSGSDPGQLAASTHGSSGSKHKHKHKRHREDSECSDSQRL